VIFNLNYGIIIDMDNPLKQEFEYYKNNQKDLAEKYGGRFIVIKDREIKGVYDTEIEAYQEAQKSYQLGSFLIQKVEAGEGSYTQTFYSRVSV
jgi:hypothetical protein